jgi:hypothetical protein
LNFKFVLNSKFNLQLRKRLQNRKVSLESKSALGLFSRSAQLLHQTPARLLLFFPREAQPNWPSLLHSPSLLSPRKASAGPQAGLAATLTHARLNPALNPAYPVMPVIAASSPRRLGLGRLRVHATLTSCSAQTPFLTHGIGGEK